MMTVAQARKDLDELQKKLSAYDHALGLMSYDGLTAAPKGTAANRAQSMGVLSGELYRLSTGPETVGLLEYLNDNPETLDEKERRAVFLLRKDILRMQRILLFFFYDGLIRLSHIFRYSQSVDLLAGKRIKVVDHGQVVQNAAKLYDSFRLLICQVLNVPVPIANLKPQLLVLVADMRMSRRIPHKGRVLFLIRHLGLRLVRLETDPDRLSL